MGLYVSADIRYRTCMKSGSDMFLNYFAGPYIKPEPEAKDNTTMIIGVSFTVIILLLIVAIIIIFFLYRRFASIYFVSNFFFLNSLIYLNITLRYRCW